MFEVVFIASRIIWRVLYRQKGLASCDLINVSPGRAGRFGTDDL